jgi:hypothetical protein
MREEPSPFAGKNLTAQMINAISTALERTKKEEPFTPPTGMIPKSFSEGRTTYGLPEKPTEPTYQQDRKDAADWFDTTPDKITSAQIRQYKREAKDVGGEGNQKPSIWDIQKEARTTVNAMINQNMTLQMQAFKDPKLMTNLIDSEVERLSKKYGVEYEPITTPQPEGETAPANISMPTSTLNNVNPKITDRIKQLRSSGISDAEISRALKEKGIDPTIYGLTQ